MSFNPKEWTTATTEIVAGAQKLAKDNSHTQIAPIHVAVALFEKPDGLGKRIAEKCQADPKMVEKALQRLMNKQSQQRPPPDEIGISRDLSNVLKTATEMQKKNGDSFLAVDHLLLATVKEKRDWNCFIRGKLGLHENRKCHQRSERWQESRI